jgi:(p)ppGpp synthase/HD superfamily hydrolase
MTINNALLEKAIIFATKAHAGIFRKGDGRAYILHPLSVMNRVTELKKDEVSAEELIYLQIVSILHDCVEDEQLDGENVTIEIIEAEFGARVARGVGQLSLDKENYKTIGKQEYLVIEMNKMDDDIYDIKLCDRLDNIHDMDSMDVKDPSFKPYYIKQTWYVLSKQVRDFKPSHLRAIAKIEEKLNSYN